MLQHYERAGGRNRAFWSRWRGNGGRRGVINITGQEVDEYDAKTWRGIEEISSGEGRLERLAAWGPPQFFIVCGKP